MFRKNLLLACRNIKNNKSSSFINISGLAIGMGVCLAILQYINFELTFDKFHKNTENSYRLVLTQYQNGEVNSKQAKTSYAIGPNGKTTIPEIENFVRIHPQYFGALVTNPENDNLFLEEKMLFVDSTFFNVFNFSLKQGHPSNVLNDKYSIVITEEMSTKYFGHNVDPIGKILKVDGWVVADYVVTGVLKTLPSNTHLDFDFLIPLQSLLEGDDYGGGRGNWGRTNFFTYFTLNRNSNVGSVEGKINELVYDNFSKTLDQNGLKWEFNLQPVKDIHLYSDDLEDNTTIIGSILNTKALGIIASLIMLVAWLNFINLSIASSMKRSKDVGVRKALGAINQQLQNQFIIESLVINILAAILSIFIAIGILEGLGIIMEKRFTFVLFENSEFWIAFIFFILFSTIISGFYPAFVLSSIKAVNIQMKSITPRYGLSLRRGLLIFQFSISALLLSGTYIIYSQITYMKNQNSGVDMKKILIVRGPERITDIQSIQSNLASFKIEASKHSSILTATSSGTVPGKGHNAVVEMRKLGEDLDKSKAGGISYVDFNFFETYEFEIIAGNRFAPTNNSNRIDVIINEKAVNIYELGTPEEAINKQILSGRDTLNVIAVLKDFHWQSLKDEYMPIIFIGSERARRYFSFKLNSENLSESLEFIQESYNEIFPGNPFDFFFLEDEYNKLYKTELQFGKIFVILSILAIFIASLGLYAFVSFSAIQRTKEMGIRKILGAEVKLLMLILSKEYFALLLVSNLLAIPLIIYGAGKWLSDFPFRINLGIEHFIFQVIILYMISFLAVGFQIYKVAKVNPVHSLKIE